MDAAGKKAEMQKIRTPICKARQGHTQDRSGEGWGGVTSLPRRWMEEEDNGKAPAALQRGCDRVRRELRRGEARDLDFVPCGSSSDLDSFSYEGLSFESFSEGNSFIDRKLS